MKLAIGNPETLFLGLACLTSVYAQGLTFIGEGEAYVRPYVPFDERSRNDINAFRQRYRERGPPIVPEESEWAAPSSSDDIMVRKSAWDDFVTYMTTEMPENPMWYLLRASHLLRYFSRDAEVMAQGIYDTTKNVQWLEFRDAYFEIIAPLMTEFTWEQPDKTKAGSYFQTKHHNLPRLPRGLMDRAGLFDSSFQPDRWNSTMPDGTPNPYTRDTFTLKVAVGKLFQPRVENFDGEQVVTVSDTRFDTLWTAVKTAYDRLTPLTKKLATAVNKEKWTLGNPGGAATKKLDMKPRQTREFKREDIGYEGYYEKFWEEFDAYDEQDDPSKQVQSEWVVGLILGHRWKTGPSTNVFVAYGILVTTVYNSVLPLMMDMLADIALEANVVARKSLVSIDPLWGLPKDPDFEVDVKTLQKFPEWTEGHYMTWGFPIAEQILPMVAPIIQQQREERDKQYELWKQEKEAKQKAANGFAELKKGGKQQ
ncbi:hypothetical protein TWF481_006113 [Arthrobotrys musiformis]|uniref:Uncharacterized protein n=1 Tax=Arthrobotrys musiformis TaxID=47236 RepID=A0AAV9WFP9_9PEZI